MKKGKRVVAGFAAFLVLLALYCFAGTDDRMNTRLTAKQQADVVARWRE